MRFVFFSAYAPHPERKNGTKNAKIVSGLQKWYPEFKNATEVDYNLVRAVFPAFHVKTCIFCIPRWELFFWPSSSGVTSELSLVLVWVIQTNLEIKNDSFFSMIPRLYPSRIQIGVIILDSL